MNLQISFSQENDISIISLQGRFLGSEVENFLKEVDEKLEKTGCTKIVINLEKLEYIGSQGASALVSLTSKYQVKLAHVPSLAKDTLVILKFDKFFEIFDSVKKAVDSFKISLKEEI